MMVTSHDVHGKLQNWLDTNTFHWQDFSIDKLAETVKNKGLHVTVVIPAKEVASTVGDVLDKTVKPLLLAQVVKEVVVIDAHSKDETGRVAAEHGATTVLQRAQIASQLGPSLGKGDAMWRALLATSNTVPPAAQQEREIIAFLDGDTSDANISHLIGIIGPLIENDDLQMVKGSFDRPFKSKSGDVQAHQGGRVTEILARPLLNGHFPELAGFRQPLAGEFAARRKLLHTLKFPVGYGVEIGTLIDAYRTAGLSALAECDLGVRQNDHKELRQLGAMALTILNALERRLNNTNATGKTLSDKMWLPWDRDYQVVSAVERPCINDYLFKQKHGLPRPPFIDVPEILNVRDIGGYPMRDESTVRRNIIFRSADFRGLTDMGIQQLQSLGIQVIFDLRSTPEVERTKQSGTDSEFDVWTALSDGPMRMSVPIFSDSDYSPEGMAVRFQRYASEGVEGFIEAYSLMLTHAQPALSAIFQHLLSCHDEPSPCLIHCTAGKDRTGVIVMVLLMLAGCSPDVIAQEYHLSEIGLGANWRAEAVSRLRTNPIFQGKDPDGIERMVGARYEVMYAMVMKIQKEYGGIEPYLTGQLGFRDSLLDAVKAVLRAG